MPDRPTFAMALNSTLPSKIGRCASDISPVAQAVNEAQQYLMIDPRTPDEGWFGGHAEMLFNLQVSNLTALITTPREVARVIVLDICKRPKFLRNGFYEYLRFGTGKQPKGCNTAGAWCGQETAGYERDDVCTLSPFPTNVPATIRLYPSDNADLGKRVVLQGPDQNGNPVTSTDPTTGQTVLGEFVTLKAPFATSAYQYQGLTGIIKDVTKGHVTAFTIDSLGNQAQLTSLEWNETVARYKQYFLNGLPANCCNTATGIVQVQAQVRLDFIPVASPSDYLTIPNVPALIEEVQARRYAGMDTDAGQKYALQHHAQALALLFGQIDLYEGKIQTAINVSVFPRHRLRPQPI